LATDGNFKVSAAAPDDLGWEGRLLESVVDGGQPLFLFGDRAGVMDVKIDGTELADRRLANAGSQLCRGGDDLFGNCFADWRKIVSLNVTCSC
jgi:two-component system cell cycle sensor histidine kinase PleC